MLKIAYTKRIIAFIDILGFSKLVFDSSNDNDSLIKLNELVSSLSSSMPEYVKKLYANNIPERLIPKYLYISDCIILSCPIDDQDKNWRHYDGLNVVAMISSILTHKFLDLGFLLRGGIEIGDVWFEENNIVGPAYIEAHFLEKNAGNPIIKLSDKAKERWQVKYHGDNLCFEYDNNFIVNTLIFKYMDQKYADKAYEAGYDHYTEAADKEIKCIEKWDDSCEEKENEKMKALAKWDWIKNYISFSKVQL